ncbi:hypothetical protein BD410DRAFT_628878 [Rickenella mellea]|uniref:Uncharacterized protein n=1 Tax=Rickenella mellea TaxID=50990 RepID=A0A4Y7QDL9_9AGAM|nr:hypothetical protein BD410DRAFT_628878 [Rickenella mellea]
MTGCTLFFKNRLGWVFVIPISVIESISTGLMTIKAIQHFRVSRSSLMTTIYNDGLLYFAYIQAITIANLTVMVSAPADIGMLVVVFQRVLHSVLCSRVLLHIRSAYEAQNRHLIGNTLPTMVVAQTEPVTDGRQPSNHLESQDGARN